MAFERPSPGNPRQLTVDQHIFPARSIQRFYGPSGRVQVFDRTSSKSFPTVARNPIFCAQRVWHQWAESGFMRDIESRFQLVASAIVSGKIRHITPFESSAITRMYALWLSRYRFQKNDGPDPVIKGVHPERDLTIDSQEILESKGIIFARPDGTVPMRHLVGVNLQWQVDDLTHRLRQKSWGIVHAGDGEFLVPDNFGNFPFLPLSPTTILVYAKENTTLRHTDIASINYVALMSAGRYVFARDWSAVTLGPSCEQFVPLSRERAIQLP
jgi:hypothetical protein